MGKKSSSAPAMDPAVGKALEKQADVAERQQEWYENELYPWYKESTLQQNALQQKLVESSISDAEWWRNYTKEQTDRANEIRDQFYDRWKQEYAPVEDRLLQQAEEYNTDAYAERQAQSAIGDLAAQYQQQRQSTALQMSKYGVDPTSGQYMGQMNALGVNEAAATAAAANAARQAAIQLGWDKNLQMANLGLQYAGIVNQAGSVLNQTASTGGSGTNASMGVASNASTQQLGNIGGLAQTGLQSYQSLSNAWGQYGNLGMQASNYNMQAWQTEQQANASAMGGIGSLVGAGLTTAAIAM